MGLLDSVIGMVGGGAQGGGGINPALLNAIVSMLGNDAQGGGLGGLGGLLGKLQQAGLGDVASSWVGSGQNQPISADQVSGAFGSDVLGNLANQLGLGQDEVASQLSQHLPQVVDHLTPQGQVSEGGLGDIGALLGKLTAR
jgi:uncharacterized protein YidB (DUF937 family)